MQNANYNLVKLLLAKLDDSWRVERHYAEDADKTGCQGCQAVLKEILEADRKHAEMLKEELSKHIKGNMFE